MQFSILSTKIGLWGPTGELSKTAEEIGEGVPQDSAVAAGLIDAKRGDGSGSSIYDLVRRASGLLERT